MKKVFVKRQVILHENGHDVPYRGGEHWVSDAVAAKLLDSGNAELMEQAETSNKSMTAADKKQFMAGHWPGKRPGAKVQAVKAEAPESQPEEVKADKPKAAKARTKTVSRETESPAQEAE